MKYKVGDEVLVKGKINNIDKNDQIRPYYVEIDNEYQWIRKDKILGRVEETDTREEITWENLQTDDVVTDRDGDSPSCVIAITKKGFLAVEENEEFPYFTTFEEAKEMNWKIKQPKRPEEKQDEWEEEQTDVVVEQLRRDIEKLTGKDVLIV
jgi:hypothetical protein